MVSQETKISLKNFFTRNFVHQKNIVTQKNFLFIYSFPPTYFFKNKKQGKERK